jgi:hypothetical protein
MAMRAFPLIAALLLTACQTATVQTDFDPAAPFAAYRTYSWLPVETPRGMNPIMFRRVKASIDRSLSARGYTQAEPGDFAISFTLDEDKRTEVNDYSWGGAWGGWGWGGWRSGWGCCWGTGWGPFYPAIDVYTVRERSIIIDIYDGKTRSPAWHGVVTRDSYSRRYDTARLDKAVDEVLAQFPPQPAMNSGGN